MEPETVNPVRELKRIQDELNKEHGVLYALKELSRGETPQEIFRLSQARVEMLTSMAERLKRIVR